MNAPVAIVGIGCRFPGGVVDPASFWRVVRDGVDTITEIPADRFDAAALFEAGGPAPGRIATRWGGFLDGIDQFDAGFFSMAPREADRLDPQQRLLLETSWEALEDAGQPVDALLGSRVGVFVGMWVADFEARLFADPEVDFFMTTGTGRYAASGPPFVRARPAGSERHRRHRLLVVAGRRASRLPEPAQRRMPAGARRRRQHDPAAAHHDRLLAGRHDGGRRPLQVRRRARRRLRAQRGRRRWSRSSCWSARSPTATASTP